MRQHKNVNLVPGSFSNIAAYSPIQQNQQQKTALARKNSNLISVRQSSSNRNINDQNTSQRPIQDQSQTNNYATLLKQEEEDEFQFMNDPDYVVTKKEPVNFMYQETFRTNNQISNQSDQYLSKKQSSQHSTVRQSHQQISKTQQDNAELNINKENICNYNTSESQMKKNNSAGCLGLKSKQKQFYSNASHQPVQSNYQSQIVKDKFKSEQNPKYVRQTQNENQQKSRSPSYSKIQINKQQTSRSRSPSPINTKRQQLAEKSSQNYSTNTKSNKYISQQITEKQNNQNNKSSNKSSTQVGSETPKLTKKQQQQSQFNLGYSPILKMDKGEFCNNLGGEDDDEEENSELVNFNKYSAKMANNIIENILDKDDIYEKTRLENKTFKENIKEQSNQIARLEQQLKVFQVQNQELSNNLSIEKERYQQELIKFSEKIQRLKNIQTLYMEEKSNSEKIEQKLNEKQNLIANQQSKLHQMVDWIFKTYSCLVVTKTSPNFEQDDLEYIWSQMTHIIRILSDDIIELQLENSLKQLLKQPLKLVKETQNCCNNTAHNDYMLSNSSRVIQNGSNNNKQNNSNLSSNNSKNNNTALQKDCKQSQRDHKQSDEANSRLPYFATEPDESLVEKTLKRNLQGVNKSHNTQHQKTDSNTDDTLLPFYSFERAFNGYELQNNILQINEKEIEHIAEESQHSQILNDLKVINESEQTLKNCIKKDINAQSNEVNVKRQLNFESEQKTDEKKSQKEKSIANELEQKENYVIAISDFVAQTDKDLSFKKGDKIQIVKRTKDGWWIGLLNKNIGYFPCNHVKEVKK
ncbi:hypothetical protein TTHERM_00923010 (macronuclear) [Tetrahymena thermophila SB210]|uniref:SH3 domain-containing protein n=1 Tax=Tetrahymena thermophila (strain SB210) TaxID=312017 RepID=Q23WP4_TETTS|nr:hypothetical protein TTHERM_00923010 [Tetrahymena thermophila SB210]EAS00936.2 hypothetical protein TTHERM_00923010 [Tetrahymena thermophila SB210]|eukprot:XP_001021181.2 hypothetical protein TTHERM_00923010 [Tetrahymena thermophila SB210]